MRMTKEKISECLDLACKDIQSNAKERENWIINYLRPLQKERILNDCLLVDDLLKNKVNPKVLDMGSAPFYTALTLQNLGYELTCTDISPKRFGHLIERIGLEVIQTDFEKEKLPFANDSFDVILFSEVFEHLRIDLIFTLSEIKRVMKSSGKLILSTPNFFDYTKLTNLIFRRQTSDIFKAYSKLHDLGHMGHVREYTRRDVIRFLEKMDLIIDQSFYRGISPRKNNFYSFGRYWAQKLFPSLRVWFVVIASK